MKFLRKTFNNILEIFGLKIIQLKRHKNLINLNENPDDITLIKSIIGEKNLTIFDIGAHKGETLENFTRYFNKSRIYSFEPFEDSFKILSKKALEIPNSKVFNFGISNFNGTKILNSYIDSDNPNISAINSTLKIQKGNFIPTYSMSQEVECDFMKLDTFINENDIDSIDLLKIDVQGSEYSVIEGAEDLFMSKKIKCIFIEIAIAEYYENQKDFNYYISTFKSYDYKLIGLCNLITDKNKNTLYLDAIFSL